MSGLIAGLAGAGGAASTTGGYYQGAANDIVNATGSPAAATFTRLLNRSLQPQFAAQNAQTNAGLAAQGITNSGQGRSDFGNTMATQSGQIAGADAPLYSQALGEYGNIIGAMPGAQVNSYQDAINNFYQALSAAGSAAAGVPPTGLSGSPGPASGGPYNSGSWNIPGGGGSPSAAPDYYASAGGY